MEEINKSYYAIIPANIRYDDDLVPNAKLLYGEITALCNEKGYCWASNEYFAKLYDVEKKTVSRWIGQLVKKGYVKTELIYKDGSKEIAYRYLEISGYPTDKKVDTPMDKKAEDNNTVFNNTINKDIYSPSEDELTEVIDKYEDFLNKYHKTCTKLPKVAKLTSKRKTKINKLLKEMSLDEIEKALVIINNSAFCTGGNERNWKADFDFCLRADKLANALEGKYSNTNFTGPDNSPKNQKSKYKEF